MSWVRAIALDLDGTIASHDVVKADVLSAISQVRSRGFRVLLVTGRTVAALKKQFPGLIGNFDAVVAENGSVLLGGDRHRLLAEPVNRDLADELTRRGMRMDRGEVLLATAAENDSAVLREVTDRGLDCVLLRNRGELMILPAGVSKGSGLLAALELLGLSPHNTIAVGDAENDHAMFEVVEFAVATANAVPSVREHADVVLDGPNGAGVIGLLSSPLMDGERHTSARRQIRVGTYGDGTPTLLSSTCSTVMIVGGSGRGKSYLAGVVIEQLLDTGYQALVIDPEGEHSALGDLTNVEVVQATDSTSAESAATRLQRGHSVVLDLSAASAAARLKLSRDLATQVVDLRAESGVPQWIVVDEAHALVGEDGPLRSIFDPTAGGHLLVTYHPERLCPQVLSAVDVVLSASPPIDRLIDIENLPAASLPRAAFGQALLLQSDRAESARPFTVAERITAHQRHQRKYAHTMLPPGKGFQFRSSTQQHLAEALSMEQFQSQLHQVSAEILAWHLRHGDLSRWFGEVVQDRDLARIVAQLEADFLQEQRMQVQRCRNTLGEAIEDRYLPAERQQQSGIDT